MTRHGGSEAIDLLAVLVSPGGVKQEEEWNPHTATLQLTCGPSPGQPQSWLLSPYSLQGVRVAHSCAVVKRKRGGCLGPHRSGPCTVVTTTS